MIIVVVCYLHYIIYLLDTPATRISTPVTTPTPSAALTTTKHSWSCDFEGLDKTCAMTKLSYGATFNVATRSFRMTTGPQSDHTTGNGKY